MTTDLILAARLQLDSQRWVSGLTQAGTRTKSFVSGMRREFDALRGTMNSVATAIGGVSIAYGTLQAVMASARVDEAMTRIRQSAGATQKQVEDMRASMLREATRTGKSFDDMLGGMEVLIAGNLSPDKAVSALQAINTAARITGAQFDDLGKALMVMSTNFGTNLQDVGETTSMLEKMTVAGRQGFVELNNLADVIPRVAVASKTAGMDDSTMFAFLETLSNAEQDPNRLSTLAESTLRLFNNPQYRKQVTKATGVKFTDAQDNLRPVEDIFGDLQNRYKGLKTSGERQRFAGDVFGQMDITTQTGVMSMLDGGLLGQMAEIKEAINGSSGIFAKELGESMNNAAAQAGVLAALMRDAADGFARPVNEAFTKVVQHATASKEDGGLGMDGTDLLLAGGGAVVGGSLLARAMRKGGGKLMQKLLGVPGGGLAAGVAMGSALEKAGAATPVFIVGAAPGLLSGGLPGAGPVAAGGGKWATRAAKVATGVVPAALAGWEVGSWVNRNFVEGTNFGDALGRDIAKVLAFFGNKNAQEALKMELQVNINDRLTTAHLVPQNSPSFANVVGGVTTRHQRNLGRLMDPER